jgi:hypothetical protein
MLIQSKMQNSQLKLNQRDCRIYIYKDDKELKSVKTKLFKERGMKILPKELYKLICKDLTAANTYDRFLDRYYTWDEGEEEC